MIFSRIPSQLIIEWYFSCFYQKTTFRGRDFNKKITAIQYYKIKTMKKKISLITGLCAAILFSSCKKEETFDNSWQLDNETQFAKITANTAEYTKLNSESKAGFIMYKELVSGTGDTPIFTDQVKVLYTGWFKRDWSMPDTYSDNQGKTVTNKIIFDSTENRNNIPSTFSVNPHAANGIIDGFSTALQHMQVGDKWEIWIPWKLGYGSAQNGIIKAYTTLVFEVELVGIVK